MASENWAPTAIEVASATAGRAASRSSYVAIGCAQQLGGAGQHVPVLAVGRQQPAATGDLAEHLEDFAVFRRQEQGLGRSGGEVVDQALCLLVERVAPEELHGDRARLVQRGDLAEVRRAERHPPQPEVGPRLCRVVGPAPLERRHVGHRRYGVRHLEHRRRAATQRAERGVRGTSPCGVPRVAGVDVGVDEAREHQEPGGVDPFVRLDRGAAVDPGLDDAVVAQQVGPDQTLRGDECPASDDRPHAAPPTV